MLIVPSVIDLIENRARKKREPTKKSALVTNSVLNKNKKTHTYTQKQIKETNKQRIER